MDLPREIRLQILGLLLPTRKYVPIPPKKTAIRDPQAIEEHRAEIFLDSERDERRSQRLLDRFWSLSEGQYIPLRHDFESCHMAVLRVNRALCEECAHTIYHGTCFEATFYEDKLDFRDRQYELDVANEKTDIDNLKHALQPVESLLLRLPLRCVRPKLRKTYFDRGDERSKKLKQGVQHLVDILKLCPSVKQILLKQEACVEDSQTILLN
jgi:hypothetical protein